MVRKWVRLAVCFAVIASGLTLSLGASTADDKKPLDTETIMKKMHNKKGGLVPKADAAVKAEKWDDAEKFAKGIKELGTALGQNKPEKGPADSWKKLTDDYKVTADALADGLEKKDAKASKAAILKFTKACDACHEKHRD
ncbi:hypothetical protein FRUB_01001 [Fimbriiglobus ruber]|uniref:Cytochrome c n=2 Tax=Fimbriiglobus ruber TaxID=1908690 RepID=A0A225E138_9BACT|nr:hypothetical protein FRUB_01001 [Fimbriiglobus ruber]